MKNRKRPYFGFNSVDQQTGYAVRFEQARDGGWAALPVQFCAVGVGSTVGQARKSVSKAITFWLESAQEEGLPIPEPERRETCLG